MPAPDAAPRPALIEAVAAAAAAAAAHAARRIGEPFRRWDKAPGNPVCEVDLEVDALLKASLAAIDPAAGWLSEETADDPARLDRRRLWVVDPIDGTRDFLRGRAGWCVSVALVEDGAAVLGVLDAPLRGERWLAVAGGGATRNGGALRASGCTALAGARVPADQVAQLGAGLVTVPRPNSIALRMGMVAAGEADLCLSIRWGGEWDIAAAALIAAEAGAAVSDALGEPLRFNRPRPQAFGLLVSAPAIHGTAVALLGDRARAAKAKRP